MNWAKGKWPRRYSCRPHTLSTNCEASGIDSPIVLARLSSVMRTRSSGNALTLIWNVYDDTCKHTHNLALGSQDAQNRSEQQTLIQRINQIYHEEKKYKLYIFNALGKDFAPLKSLYSFITTIENSLFSHCIKYKVWFRRVESLLYPRDWAKSLTAQGVKTVKLNCLHSNNVYLIIYNSSYPVLFKNNQWIHIYIVMFWYILTND